MAVEFLTLSALLGRSLVDKRAQAVFSSLGNCTNIEDLGSLFKKFEDSGVCFLAEEKPKAKRGWRRRGGRLITTIWLYSKEYPSYDEYLGTLPGSVKFGDSKDSVMETLGNPWKVVIRKLPKPSIQLAGLDLVASTVGLVQFERAPTSQSLCQTTLIDRRLAAVKTKSEAGY